MHPRDLPRAALPFALAASCAFASPDDPLADVPARADITDATAAPDITDVPAAPDITDVPAAPDITDVPARPDITDVPSIIDVTDVPALPDITDVPARPDIIDVPALPDIVDAPPRPDVTDAPAPQRAPFVLSGASLDEGTAVAFDPIGHLALGAQFNAPVTVGPRSVTPLGGSDALVVSLDADGAVRWSQRVGSTGADTVSSVAVDSAGNVYACGTVGAQAAIGTTTVRPPDGAPDGWVASWTRDGTLRWAVALTGAGSQQPLRVSSEIGGSLWVAGTFDTSLSTTGASGSSRGGADVFLLRLDASSGAANLSRFFGTASEESFGGLAARAGRGIAIGINHSGGLSVGSSTVTSAGQTDGTVARYDVNGTYLGHFNVSSPSADQVTAVALDDTGAACAAGTSFASEVSVGPARVSLGFADAFVGCVTLDITARFTLPIAASDPLGSVERVRALATSADGSLWIAGDTGAATLSLGPRTAMGPRMTAGFVARVDRSGTALALEIASAPSTFAGVAASDGAWAVAGSFDARGSFGGSAFPAPVGRDAFVARVPR